jgi:hypothetical protein
MAVDALCASRRDARLWMLSFLRSKWLFMNIMTEKRCTLDFLIVEW